MTAYNEAAGKTFDRYKTKENNEAYKKSQEQRRRERDIRQRKKDLSLAKLSGDEKVLARAKNNLSNAQSRMRDFIGESGNTRRYDREQIY